jgi:hypothetical protein
MKCESVDRMCLAEVMVQGRDSVDTVAELLFL